MGVNLDRTLEELKEKGRIATIEELDNMMKECTNKNRNNNDTRRETTTA